MWRLGTVPYLNALPLVDGLRDGPDVDLVEELPSRLAPRLRAGDLDLALVSSVELFRAPRLGWIAGPAITSEGDVRSILLYLRVPVGDVRTLALDTSSLSAAAMSQVCLRSFFGIPAPQLLPAPPEQPLDEIAGDAILRIGDPALRTPPGRLDVLDLGGVWTEHTGLPFVYALWLTRPDLDGAAVAPLLAEAAAQGLANRHVLADRFADQYGMERKCCRDYLDDNIGYQLGARELEGLVTYGRLAHGLGLVDHADLPHSVG
jgi:chorismate dehydratase